MITWLKVIDYFKKCLKWQSNRIHDSFVIVIVPALEETRWSLVVVSVSAVGTLGEADADDRVRGFHWVLHQEEVAQHDVEDDQLH